MRVYLIKNNEEHYKIGYSGRKVHKRLEELQTANGSQLWFISEYESKYARRIEAALHNIYSAYCVSGEWFCLPVEEVLMFKKRAKDIENNLTALEKKHII
jgi:hypothetical protein